jgi:hypothetical protein
MLAMCASNIATTCGNIISRGYRRVGGPHLVEIFGATIRPSWEINAVSPEKPINHLGAPLRRRWRSLVDRPCPTGFKISSPSSSEPPEMPSEIFWSRYRDARYRAACVSAEIDDFPGIAGHGRQPGIETLLVHCETEEVRGARKADVDHLGGLLDAGRHGGAEGLAQEL